MFKNKVTTRYHVCAKSKIGKNPHVWFAPKNGDINDAQAKWMQDFLDKNYILWTEEGKANRFIFVAAKTSQEAMKIYADEGISPQYKLEPFDPGEGFTVSDELKKQIDVEFNKLG